MAFDTTNEKYRSIFFFTEFRLPHWLVLIHAGQKGISAAPNHSVGEHKRAKVKSECALERNTFHQITVDILQRRDSEF